MFSSATILTVIALCYLFGAARFFAHVMKTFDIKIDFGPAVVEILLIVAAIVWPFWLLITLFTGRPKEK